MTSTRSSLLRRLGASGEDAAWTEFHRRYGDLILRAGMRQGLDVMEADDVRQRVLLVLFRRMPSFRYDRGRGRFRSYLMRVTYRAARRQLRARRAECGLLESDWVDDGAAFSRWWEMEWRMHHVRQALDSVRSSFDPRNLQVFERLLAGESPESIARNLAMKRATVYKVKERILKRVRDRVAEQVAAEGRIDAP